MPERVDPSAHVPSIPEGRWVRDTALCPGCGAEHRVESHHATSGSGRVLRGAVQIVDCPVERAAYLVGVRGRAVGVNRRDEYGRP